MENDIHHLLHSQVLNAYDAARILALAWNVTLHNFTTEELGYYLNQSWKDYNESIGMKGAELVEALDYNLINIVSPYNGLAVRKIMCYKVNMNLSNNREGMTLAEMKVNLAHPSSLSL